MSASTEANLSFIVRQDTKPYFHSALLTGGKPKFFFDVEARTVSVHDLRGLNGASVDREGFELLHRPTSVSDLNDDEAISGDATEWKQTKEGLALSVPAGVKECAEATVFRISLKPE